MDQREILASGWRANLGIALLMGKVTSSYICFFPSKLLQQLSQPGMRCQLNGRVNLSLQVTMGVSGPKKTPPADRTPVDFVSS